ncbi:MAG: hypothetical protein AAF430_14080 [Myxococcota bacterium]
MFDGPDRCVCTPKLPSRNRTASSRGLASKRGLWVALWFLLGLASPTGAVVLDFESQTSGAPGGPIVEGDFTLTVSSVEPGGSLCPTPGATGCPTFSNGQYVVTDTISSITLARTDGAAFDLESISYSTFLMAGLIAIDGTTSGGGSVADSFSPTGNVFVTGSLSSDFDEVVSVTISYPLGVFVLAVDDITVTEPPDPVFGTGGTMELLSDARFIDGSGTNCTATMGGGEQCDPPESFNITPSAPFATFDVSAGAGLGFASQDSTATSAELAGDGLAAGSADISGETSSQGTADSVYDVSFRLDRKARVRIIGTLDNSETSGIGIGFGTTDLTFTRGATVLYAVSTDTSEQSETLDFDDVLLPGDYRLLVEADGTTYVTSAFDFRLVANPVPALPSLGPIALAALAAVLAGIGARSGRGPRRSRRH